MDRANRIVWHGDFLQKSTIIELESGKLNSDNKLLQRIENKLEVWLTGDPARLGTPKTIERKSKNTDKATKEGGHAGSTKLNEDALRKKEEEVSKMEDEGNQNSHVEQVGFASES